MYELVRGGEGREVWVEREGVDEVFGKCSHVGGGVSARVCTCLWLFVCSRGRVRERESVCRRVSCSNSTDSTLHEK